MSNTSNYAAIGLTVLIASTAAFFVDNINNNDDLDSARKASLQHVFNKEMSPVKSVKYLKENGWSMLETYNKQAEKYPKCLEESNNAPSHSELNDALKSCMGVSYFNVQDHKPNPHFFIKALKAR